MVNTNLQLKNMPEAMCLLTGCLCLLSFQRDWLSLLLALVSSVAGISLIKLCTVHLSRAVWSLMAAFTACYGVFLTEFSSSVFWSYAGSVLAGAAAGGMLFIFPCIAADLLSCKRTVFPFSAVWSISISMTFALRLSLAGSSYVLIILSFILLLPGSRALKNISFSQPEPVIKQDKRVVKKTAYIKAFALFTGICTALVLSMAAPEISGRQASSPETWLPVFLFAAGAATGPVILAFFAGKKGIFGSAILNIFLIETAVMCFSFYDKDSFLLMCGYLSLGLCLSSSVVICPLIAYYLFGPENYANRLCGIFKFLISGYWVILPVNFLEKPVFAFSPAVICTFILLLCSFFTVFSAWKHRLVLLKSQ